MNSTVFVRPNLKAFVVGGLLVVVLQHLIIAANSQGMARVRPLSINAREIKEPELRELVRRTAESPNAEVYMRLSSYFERRGEYRKALTFLREAEKVAWPDSDD